MADTPEVTNGGQVITTEAPEVRLPAVACLLPYVKSNNTIACVDTNTREGFMLYMNLKRAESKPLADAVNTVIGLTHFFIQPMQKVEPTTGEVIIYPRYVLRCVDGQQWSGGAHSVMGCLADLLLFRPQAPWDPPEWVLVKIRTLSGGRRVYDLLPVDPPKENGGKKGGK